MACGSGACAAVVAAVANGLCEKGKDVTVRVKGGDLVVAQINSEWTRSAGAGRESQPASDAEKALFGNGKATSTMKTSYVNVIALYVPPANSGQKITAVGSERQPVKVEAL